MITKYSNIQEQVFKQINNQIFDLMSENEDVVSSVAQLLTVFDIDLLFSKFKDTL